MQALDQIRVVEIGPSDTLFARPLHPYTRALLASRPSMDPARRIEEAPLGEDYRIDLTALEDSFRRAMTSGRCHLSPDSALRPA